MTSMRRWIQMMLVVGVWNVTGCSDNPPLTLDALPPGAAAYAQLADEVPHVTLAVARSRAAVGDAAVRARVEATRQARERIAQSPVLPAPEDVGSDVDANAHADVAGPSDLETPVATDNAPRVEEPAPTPPVPTARANTDCVNPNTANAGRLQSLPRIGPAMADRIIAARPYGVVSDLTRVRGIGPATLDRLRPHVCFR